MKCVSCHAGVEKEERAGFPGVDQCRTCHTEMAPRKLPSKRVYKLPDFVFFGHSKHVAKAECSTCHGAVMEQDTVTLQQPLKMKWCVDCHRQNKATLVCVRCHELGQ